MSNITGLIISFLFTLVHSISFETTRQLLNNLLKNDTKYIRPVLNQSNPVFVDVTVRAYSLKKFDVTAGRFALLSTFQFDWRDEHKTWNVNLYEGLDRIHLPKSYLWVPNILIENSADLTAILQNDNSGHEMEVISNGRISLNIPAVFEVLCEPNIKKYPFDEHECAIVFTTDRSATYIKLQASDSIDTTHMRDNAVWKISSSSFEHKADRTFNSAITFRLIFKRYSAFQVMNFVIPVIVLVVLNLLVFVLPPESGERVSYSITILLSFIVFISGISNQLPETNNPLCLFNVYLVMQLIYSAFIATSVIGIAWLYQRESDFKVPIALEYMFGKRKANSVPKGIQVGHGGRITPHDECRQEKETEAEGNDWQSISRTVDKICYYFFVVFAVTETIIIFLIIHLM